MLRITLQNYLVREGITLAVRISLDKLAWAWNGILKESLPQRKAKTCGHQGTAGVSRRKRE
jgi:hypothetical protein